MHMLSAVPSLMQKMTSVLGFIAQLPPYGTPDNTNPVEVNGATYYEDGGDSMYLNNSVYLCGRADGDGDRFFSGSVAQAGFYNEALNASSIAVGSIVAWRLMLWHQQLLCQAFLACGQIG